MDPATASKLILIVEDDRTVQAFLDLSLRRCGYSVVCAGDGEEALAQLKKLAARVSLVLLDLQMPGKDGIEIVREIRRVDRDLPIVMLSGASTPEQAAEAIKRGANDFLSKPFHFSDLRALITKTLAAPSVEQPAERTANSRMAAIEADLDQIASSDVPVLLQGESGVGKEVLARRLHAKSLRASKPFVKINCAAIPSELLESELFGYERGAFTGADKSKPGMFEMAEGGTILLDEIGDMNIRLQAKLLQVLQDHEFRRVGGETLIRVDVRILAATHRNLEQAIQNGEFRGDLYYRLNVIAISVPPLRERKDEILTLTQHFWNKYATGAAEPPIPPLLKRALLDYDWPGNIRELENVIRRFLVLRNADLIVTELKSAERNAREPAPDSQNARCAGTALGQVEAAKKEAESQLILNALQATNWNRRRAAAALHIDYRALLYKMKRLSIGESPEVHKPPTGQGLRS